MTLIPFSLERRGGVIEYGHECLPDKYWDQVIPDPISGCWLWTGAVNKKGGHPYFYLNSKIIAPRQYISRQVYGMTEKERVHRTCDTVVCLSPSHWVIIPKGMCNRGHDQSHRDSFGHCGPCSKIWKQENNWKYADYRKAWERERSKRRVRARKQANITVFGDKPPENAWRPSAPGW